MCYNNFSSSTCSWIHGFWNSVVFLDIVIFFFRPFSLGFLSIPSCVFSFICSVYPLLISIGYRFQIYFGCLFFSITDVVHPFFFPTLSRNVFHLSLFFFFSRASSLMLFLCVGSLFVSCISSRLMVFLRSRLFVLFCYCFFSWVDLIFRIRSRGIISQTYTLSFFLLSLHLLPRFYL